MTDEQRAWRKTVHDFALREVRPRAHDVDESGEFNWDAARKGAQFGLLGLGIPMEYGGAGMDSISAAIAIEELGWGCGSTALALAAHSGLGTVPIVNYAGDALKPGWLPLVSSVWSLHATSWPDQNNPPAKLLAPWFLSGTPLTNYLSSAAIGIIAR